MLIILLDIKFIDEINNHDCEHNKNHFVQNVVTNSSKASSRFCPKCGNPIKDRATSKEINLEPLTGHEFEDLCKTVFEKVWGCRVKSGGYTNDRGKDLIMDTKQGKIVVECKHHKGRIGRPTGAKITFCSIR